MASPITARNDSGVQRNKLFLLALLLLGLVALWLVYSQVFSRVNLGFSLPFPGDVQKLQACENEGAKTGYSCSSNVLGYSECSVGVEKKVQLNCSVFSTQNAYGQCRLQTTASGTAGFCETVPLFSQQKTIPAPNATPQGASNASGLPFEEVVQGEVFQLAFCGDGECDANESCNNCVADCGCGSSQYCHEEIGACYEQEACGDGRCTEIELGNAICCGDCGCLDAEVCSGYSQKCLQKATVPEQNISIITRAYLANNTKDKLVGVFDSYYGDVAVKDVVFDCTATMPQGFPCRSILVVAGNGTIIGYAHTT